MSGRGWRTSGAVAAAVVAVHLVVGLTSATPAMHPGGDNAAYVSLAGSLARDGSYVETWHPGTPPHTQYPPLYPGALAVLMLLGAKTWGAFKASSLVFTAMATGFCFLWVRRLHGARAAAVVALLFGIAPGVLISAQWILAEPLFMALVYASLWLLASDPRASRAAAATRSGATTRRARVELGVGLGLAVAAYLTRSAGLPLVAAIAIWLVCARRWVALGAFAGLFGIAAVPWHLRAGDEYASAFWMVNPYAPDLGRADAAALAQRLWENTRLYVGEIVPDSLAGVGGAAGPLLGVLLAGLAVWGWFRRVRGGAGVAELFLPLYAGLVLLWPSVWSSDRFALPLLPLLLLYAGEALAGLASGLPRWRTAIPAVVVGLALVLPAGSSWLARTEEANRCRIDVARGGPMGCYANRYVELQAMAQWTRERLPPGTVVFSRKPRLFHAFSGHASVVYPFTSDGRSLLVQADSMGVDHVVLGNWDGSGAAYVLPAIEANPGRFCLVAQLRMGPGAPISLLSIRDPGIEDSLPREDAGDEVATCLHEDWNTAPSPAELASTTMPILSEE